jgi:hypothetical protein
MGALALDDLILTLSTGGTEDEPGSNSDSTCWIEGKTTMWRPMAARRRAPVVPTLIEREPTHPDELEERAGAVLSGLTLAERVVAGSPLTSVRGLCSAIGRGAVQWRTDPSACKAALTGRG